MTSHRSPHLARLPRIILGIEECLTRLGEKLAESDDDPFALDLHTREWLHNMFGTASNMDDVIRGLEKYFWTHHCLRLLCDWLSGPDLVFNELMYLRGDPEDSRRLKVHFVIKEAESIPLCRRLLSFLLRYDSRSSNVQTLTAL